jgi:hypothetical protein
MAAWARNATLVGGWHDKLQQMRQSRRSGLMQGRAKAHLHYLQIEAAGLLPLGEDTAQQCAYLARDLCLGRRVLFVPLL